MEELTTMIREEEKRLGVGSEDFMERHNEIMQMIEKARQEGEGMAIKTAQAEKPHNTEERLPA